MIITEALKTQNHVYVHSSGDKIAWKKIQAWTDIEPITSADTGEVF